MKALLRWLDDHNKDLDLWFTRAFVWFEAHLPFGINDWPTWSNEGIGGLVFASLAMVPAVFVGLWWKPIGLSSFLLLSSRYERTWDAHGYSFNDEWWRAAGAILAYALTPLWL